MAIILVREKWMLYVKNLTGEKHEISIEKVRKFCYLGLTIQGWESVQ